jgi:hypothetical protein
VVLHGNNGRGRRGSQKAPAEEAAVWKRGISYGVGCNSDRSKRFVGSVQQGDRIEGQRSRVARGNGVVEGRDRVGSGGRCRE